MKNDSIKSEVFIPEAPRINNLRFRLFRDENDLPEMVRITDALRDAGQFLHVVSLEDLTSWFQHPGNCDPRQDALFAELNDQPVGYTRVFWEQEETRPARIYTIILRILPEHQGKGLEQALLGWAERRLAAIAAGHPQEMERVYSVFLTEECSALKKALETRGYQPARYFVRMRRELENLPEASLPEGIELRPALPKDYRAIWDASVEGFRDEWSSTQVTEEDYQRWLTESSFQPAIWQIAWDKQNNTPVGMVLNYINALENEYYERFRGYTEGICVVPAWRGRGVARALICRSLAMMKALNMQEVALTVDSDNPSGAQRLYLGLGYQPYQTSLDVRKPMPPGQA